MILDNDKMKSDLSKISEKSCEHVSSFQNSNDAVADVSSTLDKPLVNNNSILNLSLKLEKSHEVARDQLLDDSL